MDNLRRHIERMKRPFRGIPEIKHSMKEFQNARTEFNSEFYQNIAPLKDAQKSLEEPLKAFQDIFEQLGKVYASIPEFQNPLLESLEAFKEIGERLKYYAEETPGHFLLIAQYGWFIDLESEIYLPSKVVYEIKNKKIDAANELMEDYYRTNLERIINRLIERHAGRKKIIEQIKKSFDSGCYGVLIPTVLTQVDGICFDFTKKKFFIKEKNNKHLPQVTAELEKSAGSFLSLFLSPLQNQTPIMVREDDIEKFPCHLNRHQILHGVSTDYGTETNSLKVISLFKYVSDLLTRLDEESLDSEEIKMEG